MGGQLIDAFRQLATELGLERVTVHSSGRAVAAYERSGFAVSPHLLQARTKRAAGGGREATPPVGDDDGGVIIEAASP